jgi:hypothetical protein
LPIKKNKSAGTFDSLMRMMLIRLSKLVKREQSAQRGSCVDFYRARESPRERCKFWRISFGFVRSGVQESP